MEENNNNFKECHCEEHKAEHWVKFALLLLGLFLACYLAVYYVLDQMRHSYYIPSRMDNIDKILQEQDKLFNEMTTFPMHYNAMMNVKSPVETYKDDENDAYKVIVDLKPFNDNPDNINVDIKSNRVSISGEEEKSGKNSENVYAFSQSFVLPEKIKTNKVKKEKSGHKYIITLPIDD
ncbi:MAG: Hsp20/alpha crystallin family protein [Clostridium sp.]|nr:Hsp20/alpha crystallin family protein [Clostridium sp.]